MDWIGWICAGSGALILWCGLLLQLSSDQFTADDARILLGVGFGVLLSGLGVVVTIDMVYPDAGRPVKATQIAEANLTPPVAQPPQQPLGTGAQAITAAVEQSH